MKNNMTLKGGNSHTPISKIESHKLMHSFPVKGKVTILTAAGALVASNVVNGVINGNAISPVTYASSSDATMAALASAITLMDGVKSARVIDAGTSDRVIEIEGYENTSYVSATGFVVTAGASQTTFAVTTSANTLYPGTPVELVAATGYVTPVTVATAELTQIGIVVVPNDMYGGAATVAVRGSAVVRGTASGAVTAGPVKYVSTDPETGYGRYSSDTVTAANMAGWATTAVADGTEIDVITRY